MKQSASRFGGFGNPDSNNRNKNSNNNTGLQPALLLRQYIHDNTSAALVCPTVRDIQRNYYLLTRGRMVSPRNIFVIHENMPAHQQDYITECLDASCDYLVECPLALLTTPAYLPRLLDRLPWLEQMVEFIPADSCDPLHGNSYQHRVHIAAACNNATETGAAHARLASSQLVAGFPVPENSYHVGAPTVSCICLREGEGGRWLLTDHSDAAVIHPDEMPAPELLPRLLRHCVDITGHQLAPHLARNFDVPAPWKVYPELATKSLLIFRKNRCLTHGDIIGIPKTIIWSDALGLIY